ncbi:hypothetical protein CBR_g49075 [Chara braunii]|uniref:Protein kinase domain-containing protein n=1 Tax=Chara braunii TaxID=69332 RepID=A0A388M4E3_CHABU|nr:hypothetical protein CBR_g49075 [Chara braunii]|eukprot:GBG89365.1 hypothetical protein CBR_g49075 [Chara braunii]
MLLVLEHSIRPLGVLLECIESSSLFLVGSVLRSAGDIALMKGVRKKKKRKMMVSQMMTGMLTMIMLGSAMACAASGDGERSLAAGQPSSSVILSPPDGRRDTNNAGGGPHPPILTERREAAEAGVEVGVARLLMSLDSSSPEVEVIDKSLITGWSVLLTDTPEASFHFANETATSCSHGIRDLVFERNSSVFYYVLEESCESNGQLTSTVMSVRKADRVSGNPELVSYWWPAANDNGGLAEQNRTVVIPNQSDDGQPKMARLLGLGISAGNANLVLSTNDGGNNSAITYLSTIDSRRSSTAFPGYSLSSLAFNPTKTKLYVLLSNWEVEGMLTADVAGDEMPSSANFQGVGNLEGVALGGGGGGGGGGNSPPPQRKELFLGQQSFDSLGRCMYLLDRGDGRVWAVNMSNTTDAKSVEWEGGRDGGESPATPSEDWKSLAATSDGCHLFVSSNGQQSGVLRWIQLDSICGKARQVVEVAIVVQTGIWGISLDEHENELFLYVGAMDGQLFKLSLVKDALPDCTSSSSPGGKTPTSAGALGNHQSPPPSQQQKKGFHLLVAFSILAVAGALCVIGLVFFFRVKSVKQPFSSGKDPFLDETTADSYASALIPELMRSDDPSMDEGVGIGAEVYTMATLSRCTNNFSDAHRVVGWRGPFADAFRAVINDKEVVIKEMAGKLTSDNRTRFLVEVKKLEVLRQHRLSNLVPLKGYCREGDRAILVYPYMGGISLYDRLHPRGSMDCNFGGKRGRTAPVALVTGPLSLPFSRVSFSASPPLSGDLPSPSPPSPPPPPSNSSLPLPLPPDSSHSPTNTQYPSPHVAFLPSSPLPPPSYSQSAPRPSFHSTAPPPPPPASPPYPALPPLTLFERMSIALQVAGCLSFLHDYVKPKIVHGSIASRSVILAAEGFATELRAVLADVGVAKIEESVFSMPRIRRVEAAREAGEHGYVSPELERSGRLTTKSDVYAFGVVLLELLTGELPVKKTDASGSGCQTLVEWAGPALRDPAMNAGKLPTEILDPSLVDDVGAEGSATWKLAAGAFRVARDCVEGEGCAGIRMSDAVYRLRNLMMEAKRKSKFGTTFLSLTRKVERIFSP